MTATPSRLLALTTSSLLFSWACNDSGFDLTPSCDKGTEDCGCIADQHCIEGLVCAQGVCLPKHSGTGGTTRGSETSTGDDDETDTGDPGSTTTTSSTSGDGEATTAPADTTDTGALDNGIYTDCYDDADACASGLECIDIDPGGRVQGAMCTQTGCKGSGQCPAPSEGTAQPFCLSIPPPTDDTVCVLSCADGAECPDGMQCHPLGLGIEVCG